MDDKVRERGQIGRRGEITEDDVIYYNIENRERERERDENRFMMERNRG